MAKEFTGRVTFAISDKGDYGNELQALGLDSSSEDVVVGLYDRKGKYSMTETFR